MKIGIIEYYGHRSDVEYLIRTLSSDHEIFVVASRTICNRITSQVATHFCLEETLTKDLPKMIFSQNADLLIACTITPDVSPWLSLFEIGKPIIALVHNTHWQLSPKLNWKTLSISSVARRFRWKLNGSLNERTKITRQFSGLVFPSPDIESYAKQFTNQPTLGIQWAITLKKAPAKRSSSKLRIAVPGGIDFKFRDYNTVFSALKLCSPETPIHVDFLGAPTTKEDSISLTKLLESLPSHISASFYNAYLNTELYQKGLNASDVILINHIGKVTFAEQIEIGGISKVSGAENDQVRSARPAFVSSNYNGMSHLSDWQKTYSTSIELKELLEEFHNIQWPLNFPKINGIEYQKKEWNTFLNTIISGE